jgi:enamine deaminase RidA (YjgF/YER057c/UK114 family)
MNDRADKPGRLSVSSGSPHEPVIGFSRAVRVGNIVAVGGTTAGSGGKMVGLGDPAAQTRTILEIIAKALADAGARLEDVIRTRTDRHRSLGGRRPRAWRSLSRHSARQQHFAGHAFINPDWLVEIEADAVVSDARS